VGARSAPARVAGGDDLADDRARDRLGGAGAFLIVKQRLQKFLARWSRTARFMLFTTPGILALVLALAGVALAWACYGRVPVPRRRAGRPLPVAARKDLYRRRVQRVGPDAAGQWLTRLSVYFDNRGVEDWSTLWPPAVGGSSGRLRKLQTGFVRSYAPVQKMFFGALYWSPCC